MTDQNDELSNKIIKERESIDKSLPGNDLKLAFINSLLKNSEVLALYIVKENTKDIDNIPIEVKYALALTQIAVRTITHVLKGEDIKDLQVQMLNPPLFEAADYEGKYRYVIDALLESIRKKGL